MQTQSEQTYEVERILQEVPMGSGGIVWLSSWSGGGKTMAGIQTVIAEALRKDYAVYFGYEPTAPGILSDKFFDCAVGQHVDDFELLSPALSERFSKVGPYIHVFSMVEPGMDRVAELEKRLEEVGTNCGMPAVAVIDDLRWMVSNAEVCTEMPDIETTMQKLQELARQTGITFVVLDQLSPKRYGYSPLYVPELDDMGYNKRYVQYADYVYLMGSKCSSTDCLYLNVAKSRTSESVVRVLRMDVQTQRLTDVSDRTDLLLAQLV